jgi:hypothetical protein
MDEPDDFQELMPGDFPDAPVTLAGAFQVKGGGDGNFDELSAKGVHLEMMSDGQIWMRFEHEGRAVALFVTAEKRGKLHVKIATD